MATFNKQYTTSELLSLLKRGSLTPFYWSRNNGLYTFYLLDNRRCPKLQSDGTCSFVSHKANYYRLRNKISVLPFRLLLDSCFTSYVYTIVPDSVFLNVDSEHVLKLLNKLSDGKIVVNVVVI